MEKRSAKAPSALACAALILCLGLLAAAGCGGGGGEASGAGGTTGTSQGDAAQLAACRGNLRQIDAAARMYEAENGKQAPGIQALVPKYLPKVPAEPMGGTYSLRGGKAVCSLGHTQ